MAEHIEAFHTGAAFYLLTLLESLSKSSVLWLTAAGLSLGSVTMAIQSYCYSSQQGNVTDWTVTGKICFAPLLHVLPSTSSSRLMVYTF